MITFTVRGLPAPQGSKRAFRNKHSGRVALVESSKRVAPWRSDVSDAAERAMGIVYNNPALQAPAGRRPFVGPVAVTLDFSMPRPRSHYGSGRNAAVLKPSAPLRPAGKPDIDKLARAVLDALTGIVWLDDSQVVDLSLIKAYGSLIPAGLEVWVDELTPATVGDLPSAADVRGILRATPTEGD